MPGTVLGSEDWRVKDTVSAFSKLAIKNLVEKQTK